MHISIVVLGTIVDDEIDISVLKLSRIFLLVF